MRGNGSSLSGPRNSTVAARASASRTCTAAAARTEYGFHAKAGGKTGTTNDYKDAWFVGFTPRHVIAVWIGTDGTFSLGDKETGGRAALPAWIEIADALPAIEEELQ